ncbi:MAG: anti-sigma factor family protein, partial [Nocardioides sp.]
MSSSCGYAHLDGSYVLGALSPVERQDYERHLDDCPSCARAVQELAGLPGLLGKTDLAAIESPAVEAPLPDTLLPHLVHEVRRQQRRRLV